MKIPNSNINNKLPPGMKPRIQHKLCLWKCNRFLNGANIALWSRHFGVVGSNWRNTGRNDQTFIFTKVGVQNSKPIYYLSTWVENRKYNNSYDFRVLNNKAMTFSCFGSFYLVSASFDEAGCSVLEVSAISPFMLQFSGNYKVINIFTEKKINKETNVYVTKLNN